MDLSIEQIVAILTVLGSATGGGWAYLRGRSAQRLAEQQIRLNAEASARASNLAERTAGHTADALSLENMSKLVAILQGEVERLQADIAELKAENRELRADLLTAQRVGQRIGQLEGENHMLREEGGRLRQHIVYLEGRLHGTDVARIMTVRAAMDETAAVADNTEAVVDNTVAVRANTEAKEGA